MNAQYRLSSRVASDGSAEVMVRFYSGRLFDQCGHTGIRVPVASWNAATCRLEPPKRGQHASLSIIESQKLLDELAAFLYTRYTRCLGHTNREWLRDAIADFHGIKKEKERFTIQQAMRTYVDNHDLAHGTATRYGTMINEFDRYPHVIYVDNTTPSDIEDFARFFKDNGKSPNTISSWLKSIRAVYKYAVLQGWSDSNPFDRYKIATEVYGSVVYLTAEERDTLYRAELPAKLAVQRDIFIFQCWTGLRISDLYGLRRDNITPDGYLEYIQQKTQKSHPVTVRVPLSPAALEIINRYRYHTHGGIFPFVTEQVYRRDIRSMLKRAGIDRRVIVQDQTTHKNKTVFLYEVASSHLARRTFAELAFLSTGSERIVGSMTGHSGKSKAFLRYTTVTDEMKRAAILPDEQQAAAPSDAQTEQPISA